MNRRILSLAVPNIISNVTVPLLGLVDMALLGHLESEAYLGAISLGGMVFNLLYWGFGFLRMGTAGFSAQAFGKEDWDESGLVMARSLSLGLAIGIGLILLRTPIGNLSFGLLQGGEDVLRWGRSYYDIRIFAAPATIGTYALVGWSVGMQNTRVPMAVTVLSNVLNIVFSAIFIYVFDLKSDGAAYGTVLAQYGGLILGVYALRRKYAFAWKWPDWGKVLERVALKRYFSVNRDIFIRTMCLIAVFNYFTYASAGLGDTLLAANALLLQFTYFFSYLIDGFAFAAEALAGRYMGEGNLDKVKQAVKVLFVWGLGLSLAFSGVYALAGEGILSLLTSNAKVLQAAHPYLIWTWLIPILGFASYLWDGIFIGATAGRQMMLSMMVASLLVFFPVYFSLKGIWPNHALWAGLSAFLFARGVLQTFMAKVAVYGKLEAVQSK
ncbi:MATE family efflux transporter (plasmid) [Fulvitalea axinellae]|uniref:MATE family efflux transporter n=1 Tax=Fulvitalea axinellae TaxID=1182444 RepID=A0AAU9CIN2_9BACT|nr:MATE family efflux transporter [Fulvitalea axinellae]